MLISSCNVYLIQNSADLLFVPSAHAAQYVTAKAYMYIIRHNDIINHSPAVVLPSSYVPKI